MVVGDDIEAAVLTVVILLAVLAGLARWRKHRKETRAWLSGEDRDESGG